MAFKRIKFVDDPVKMGRTEADKLAMYGTTLEDGDKYFERVYAINREKYRPFYEGTASVAEQPVDMVYTDLTALPPYVNIGEGEKYPLPLAVISEIINRSSHRVITRNCSCRMTFNCRSYDKNIGCIHVGGPTAEEPDSVARHVSKEEAIEHAANAIEMGLLPYVGKFDYDNDFWGIWSGEPMFTICLCCPCCCLSRKSYTYLHPEHKAKKFTGLEGLKWKYNEEKCTGEDCAVCTRHCHGWALKFEDGRLHYDKSKCFLCGECMSRCPKKAISIETDDLEGTINNLVGRYDGLCGDLGFEDKDYAKAVLASTPRTSS